MISMLKSNSKQCIGSASSSTSSLHFINKFLTNNNSTLYKNDLTFVTTATITTTSHMITNIFDRNKFKSIISYSLTTVTYIILTLIVSLIIILLRGKNKSNRFIPDEYYSNDNELFSESEPDDHLSESNEDDDDDDRNKLTLEQCDNKNQINKEEHVDRSSTSKFILVSQRGKKNMIESSLVTFSMNANIDCL
jgi:hypothetical protein